MSKQFVVTGKQLIVIGIVFALGLFATKAGARSGLFVDDQTPQIVIRNVDLNSEKGYTVGPIGLSPSVVIEEKESAGRVTLEKRSPSAVTQQRSTHEAGKSTYTDQEKKTATVQEAGKTTHTDETKQMQSVHEAGRTTHTDLTKKLASVHEAGKTTHTDEARKLVSTHEAGKTTHEDLEKKTRSVQEAGRMTHTDETKQMQSVHEAGKTTHMDLGKKLTTVHEAGKTTHLDETAKRRAEYRVDGLKISALDSNLETALDLSGLKVAGRSVINEKGEWVGPAMSTPAISAQDIVNQLQTLPRPLPLEVSNAQRLSGLNLEQLFIQLDSRNDGRYLSQSGGTINGNFGVRGAAGIGTSSPQAKLHISSGDGANFPQAQITQTTAGEFARLRFNVSGNNLWDIAVGSSSNVMNFFVQGAGNVLSLAPDSSLRAAGPALQNRSSSGWAKALVKMLGGRIATCFNSQAADANGANSCNGFNIVQNRPGDYTVTFPFSVNDRYVVVTPESESEGPATPTIFFPAPNQVRVRTWSGVSTTAGPLLVDRAFHIVIF